jgi:hypothetical protein
MVLAILLGGIFGLLVAGGVLVAGMVRQARRDQNDMNEAFADARGEAHDPVFGPAPWSSIDMEALGEEEDAAPVDRSDPYATLTGVPAVSWSHSSEANGADDEIFVAEPHDTFVAEPDQTFVAEPDETFVARPAAMLPESVDNGATPASIDDERSVLWRAPAQSQVIILVVALRALADGLAATITPEGATQLDGLEEALAHARGAHERGNGNGRGSSIDVDGRDRPVSDMATSPINRGDRSQNIGSAPRRGAPRRHSGPKPITWRARAH